MIVAETDDGAFRSRVYFCDAGAPADGLDGDDLQEMLNFCRRPPKPVDKFGGEGVNLLLRVNIAKAPVKRHAHIEISDIAFRNKHRGSDIDLRRPFGVGACAALAQFGHRLFQHMLVQLNADFFDIAGLFLA